MATHPTQDAPRDAGTGENQPGLKFVDFLFTVATATGLVPESVRVEPPFKGLLSETWIRNTQWPSSVELYSFGVFCLSLITLAFSWFGYHASIEKRPITSSSFWGMLRFLIDIFLIAIYGLMLLKFNDFRAVITLLVIVYSLYSVWDIIRMREYRIHPKNMNVEYGTFAATILFIVIWLLTDSVNNYILLISSIAITFAYRIAETKLSRVQTLPEPGGSV